MLTFRRCNVSLTLLCDFFLSLHLKPIVIHCYSTYSFLLSFRGKLSSWAAFIRLFIQFFHFFWLIINHFKFHIVFMRTFTLVFLFVASRVFTVKGGFHWLFFIKLRFILPFRRTLLREVKNGNFLVHCGRGFNIWWRIDFWCYLLRWFSFCQVP